MTDQSGKNNPNYKHGRYSNPHCACGRRKDPRSIRCSICAKRSSPVDGEDYPVYIDELKEAIEKTDTFLKASKLLGVSRKWITRMAYKYEIDISHFRPTKHRPQQPDDVLIRGNIRRNSVVRRVLVEHNLMEYKCNKCQQGDSWMDKVLTLQLHHTNGDNTDNQIENLQFLCPNCHTQTNTYTGRNTGARGGDE